MTTRNSDQQTRGRSRRARATTILAAVTVAATTAGAPAPAQAAVPAVAQRWASLMQRSLTVDAQAVQLRKTLAVQQAAVTTGAAEMGRARTASTAAQAQVTTAVTAEAAAKARHTAAQQAVTKARQAATKARQAAVKAKRATKSKRAQTAAAVTRADKAVTAATTTATLRRTQAQQAAAVLNTARAGAAAAATRVTTATAAWTAASAAVEQTRQRIAGLGTAAGLAGQAGALSRDVVTQVRGGFAITDTTTVYGTTLHKTMAYAFKRMVDDAKADGIALAGGGFRTKERQIELRKINGCPDVWTAPSSSCRVPTAIPGRSLHEIGLAVDVTSGGRTLTAKSPAFKWMVLHAKEYGFVNLPSEPWHWSITGN